MTRHRDELLAHAGAVPALVEAIETAGRAALSTPSMSTELAMLPYEGLAMPATTIHAALAHQLEQSAEGIRVELHKWKQSRVPGAKKVVRLVDAASRLGWISASAEGLGLEVEALVAWCRDEVLRLDRAAGENAKRKAARLKGQAAEVVDRAVRHALDVALDANASDIAESLVLVAAEAVERQSWEAHQPEAGLVALRNASEQLRAMVVAFEARLKAYRDEESKDREKIVDEEFDSLRADTVISRTASQAGQAKLKRFALRRGIGQDMLGRILDRLRTGSGLRPDELRLREELFREFEGFRDRSEWTPL